MTNSNGFNEPKFVGFANYLKIFKMPEIGKAALNTTVYTVATVLVGTFLSLLVAVALNEKLKGRSIFRTLYFLPVVSTPAAIAMVWNWLLNDQFGLVNYFLGFFGIKGPNWLGDSRWALTSVIIVGIWSLVGYNMILLLGGLQDIPNEYYEAAKIDGAGKARQLFSITMPLLSPTLFFVLVTSVISSMQVFDLIYMLIDRSNPVGQDTQSIVYLFYRETFIKGNEGLGSAIAVVLLVVILILTMVMMKLQKKWVTYDR